MVRVTLNYAEYYTHFSFLLFIISFALPFTSSIKYFILVNSIIVGIAGNLVYMKDYQTFVEGYQQYYPKMTMEEINRELVMSNFLCHTVPLVISLFLLFQCTPFVSTFRDAIRYSLYEFIVFFTWTMVPYQDQIVTEKVSNAYPSTSYAVFMTSFITILVYTVIYFVQ